jgi:hypothetical protein
MYFQPNSGSRVALKIAQTIYLSVPLMSLGIGLFFLNQEVFIRVIIL